MKWKGRCWLLHGFNVTDPMKSVGKLIPYLEQEDIEPKLFRYGWIFLLGARFGNKRIARMFADVVEEGDMVIGHSNGCCIAHMAAHLGAPIERMAYINPALDRDARLAKQVQHLDVWHSPSDKPVRFARVLPWNAWGDMGAVGYSGKPDTRITNFDKEHMQIAHSDSHSDVFTYPKIRYFGPNIVQKLLS